MNHISTRRFWLRMDILAVLSGVLYSSWPLGPVLNPNVARNALASALEAIGQPYNWVFITGDVASSCLIILICWLIWRRLTALPGRRLLAAILINLVIFAAGTIMDTLLPEHCLPGAPACPDWRHDHLLLAHGVFSILAAICLFVSLALVWWRHRTRLLYALIAGYFFFGVFSLVEALTPTAGNWSQHYYITLCGVWLALVPYAIRQAFPAAAEAKRSQRP